MTIKPGQPFWTAFTAFAANMLAMVTVDQVDITVMAAQVSWGAAVVVSSLVAGAVYGKAKIDEGEE